MYKYYPVDRSGKFYLYAPEISSYYHRQVIEMIDGLIVDHINGDTKNNMKSNLRLVTKKQNVQNQRKCRGKTSSKYKGVHKRKDNGMWRAYINVDGKRIDLGTFKTENAAAIAYNEYAGSVSNGCYALNVIG